MPEQIRCPECNATLRVPDTLLGKNVKCPKCATTFKAEVEEPSEGIVEEPVRSSARRRPAPPEDYDEEDPQTEDDEYEARPRRGRRRGRRTAYAASAVAGPAIAMMITSGLSIAIHILHAILLILGIGLLAANANSRGVGAKSLDPTVNMASGIIGDVVGVCFSIAILMGALKMKNLNSHGYAMTACILSILPCHGCCCLGIPFGIWGLVVINKPEVKSAFSR